MKNLNTKRVVSIVLAIALSLSMIFSVVAGFISMKNGGNTQTNMPVSEYDYSANFDKNGYFKNIKATDFVTLPDYKSYEIPRDMTTVDKEYVEYEIQNIRANFSKTEQDTSTDRVINNGDTINLDYVGSVDGVEFKNGSTNGNGTTLTVGSGTYIPARGECKGFEEQLVGHKVGETFDITVQFPDGYDASEDANGNAIELSNAVANFKITINSVSVTTIPEMTDEFIKENLSDTYESYDDMYSKIERTLIQNQKESYFVEKLVEESEISEYPERAMTFAKDNRKLYIEQMATYYGMSAEDILAMDGYESFDDYFEAAKEFIENEVKQILVIQAVCENEGIKGTDKTIKAYFGESTDYSSYETYYGESYLKFVSLTGAMLDKIVPTL